MQPTAAASRTTELFARRGDPTRALSGEAEGIAAACHAMAGRFYRGGRLVVFGAGASEPDAAHVVVEFVHPVIVGKRALPAFALAGPDQPAQLELLAAPEDIALGLASSPDAAEVADTLAVARRMGMLTVALVGGDGGAVARRGLADHLLRADSGDPLVVKELQVTTYHVLWELVHVFFDQPELLS
ncbi:MAG TPA: phosphoheptose isomerase [Pseudonocardia sp.]